MAIKKVSWSEAAPSEILSFSSGLMQDDQPATPTLKGKWILQIMHAAAIDAGKYVTAVRCRLLRLTILHLAFEMLNWSSSKPTHQLLESFVHRLPKECLDQMVAQTQM